MGGCFSNKGVEDTNKVSPENIKATSSSQIYITKERTCTDVFFFILLGVFVIVLLVLLIYCMLYGDIYRIINGYDNCGAICGRENTPDNNLPCKGVNMTNNKYLLVQATGTDVINTGQINRQCLETCDNASGYKTFLNRCIPEKNEQQVNSFFSKTGLTEFFQEVSEDLNMCWEEILYLCLIAFVFAVIIVIMLKYLVGLIVWIVLIGVIIISIIGTIFLWVKYSFELETKHDTEIGQRRTISYLAYAILATIVTIIICLIIFVLRKRIKLVIQLFKEAGKALTNMPLLLFEPILTFIALTIVTCLWLYFTLWIESAGLLSVENNLNAKYVKDVTMKVTRWYNLMALFWFSQFIIGCQHLIIAGAVAKWFFTREKNQLNSPIRTSLSNLIKYHLGTIAVGSFLIAIIQLARTIFKMIEYSLRNPDNSIAKFCLCCCQCCLLCFERFLQYISRNAYIETSIYGYGFCVAGKKAFTVLTNNALRVIAINSVGDFILLLGKAFIVLITILIGIELIQKKDGVHHCWIPLGLAGLFAYLIAHCFLTVYEMTIDTIFICFCEDCEHNDGITKPYFMSRGLMEFVQDSKKALAIESSDRSSPPRGHGGAGKAWSNVNSSERT